MFLWIHRLFSSLLDIFFPPRCASCELLLEQRSLFCPSCLSQVKLIRSPLCPLCGRSYAGPHQEDHLCGLCLRKRRPFRRARAAALFEGPIMEAIHRVKYRGDLSLVKPLASLLVEYISRDGWQASRTKPSEIWDMIVPVPLHPSRLRERGFNQSALLARQMSRSLGVPADLRSLRKIKSTPPQVGLTMKERMKNVKEAFQVIHKERAEKKKVLLVDDVLTTGATVTACARVLMKAGAVSVDVLTLARTP